MPQLLILTNSIDGTCDIIASILGEHHQSFFRWNIDLWPQYISTFDGNRFELSDPTGRIIDASSDDVLLLWRKPFTELMTFDGLALDVDDCSQARRQLGQWLMSLVAMMMPAGRVRLVEPYADRRLPKLFQLREARAFFATPRSHFGIQSGPKHFGPRMVTKPLGDPSVGEERIFYTTSVDGERLFRPYPWFVQEALVQGRDVTCVFIHGHCSFYECGFVRSENTVDWRVEINAETQSSWESLKHPNLQNWEDAVRRFMAHVGLHYGRLDFILHGDTLFFLECNSNGQFGWLDESKTLPLHRRFCNAALDASSTVQHA